MASSLSARLLLYIRTVGRLRWRQWAYRPLRRAQSLLPAALPTHAEPAHPERAARLAAAWIQAWPPLDGEEEDAAAAARAGRFSFAGEAEPLDGLDWARPYVSPLWTYHLQYFDFAPALGAAWRATGDAAFADTFHRFARGWIDGTVPARGPGWEPYPISLRTVNWLRARALFGDALAAGVGRDIDASVFAQLALLERRLEWHILANHLQKNLQALAVGGLYFEGSSATRWRRRALPLLWRELFEQTLPDGGHFERSPMYHAIALGDYLELITLVDACGEAVPEAARARVVRMAEAWARLSRPDGSPHLFNDAAEGSVPPPARLARLTRMALGALPPEGLGAWSLPETGYHGWTDAVGDRLIVDCGPPGPGYQPGHAHCDLLSFELDLAGRKVVVDSGVRGYGGDPLREYVRSTRAHNTVMVAGREQSEVWGTFRVGRMARAERGSGAADGGGYRFEGGCHQALVRRTIHWREIRGARGDWHVADRVQGAEGAALAGYLHLHPDFTVVEEEGGLTARATGSTVRIEPFGADRMSVHVGERDPAQGWYCPRFGAALPAPAVESTVERNDGREFGYRIRRLER